MKTDVGITKEEFDELLTWLDPDTGRAGEKYEAIRRSLITVFLNRQCPEAEDLADETINRVARKVKELKEVYIGEPVRYFHGVAKKLVLEYYRLRHRALRITPLTVSPGELDPYLDCLNDCLARLSPPNRELILRYYQEKKRAKIEGHKKISEQMNLKAGALRVRVHRIRGQLEKCVMECLGRTGSNNISSAVI
ncbi:MAG: RNA polymerase sigma factor [Blastocatellia bacterium]